MKPGKLILVCRNKAKGDEAVEKIKAETGCVAVELWQLDLTDFSSVIAFADKFNAEESRLDILVSYGAMLTDTYEATKDGWESSYQVNHLSTALLSLLLIPKMVNTSRQHSTTPRLVIVASDVHYWAYFDDSLMNSENLTEKFGSKEYCTKSVMSRRYFDSKLFNVLYVRALAAHLIKPHAITVDCVNPGYCYSSLRRSISGLTLVFDKIMEFFLARTTEAGSRQFVGAALSGSEEGMHGSYFSNFEVTEPSDFVISEQRQKAQERIWSETLLILSKVEPKVQEIATQYMTN